MEYHESTLTPQERDFYQKMVYGFQHFAGSIKSSYILDMNVFTKCITAVQYDHPEFFYVDFTKYLYQKYEDGLSILPTYKYHRDTVSLKQEQFRSITNGLKREMNRLNLHTIYERCRFIHSYIIRSCTYDYEALYKDSVHPESYTLEGPVFFGRGVCMGISCAFRAICRDCNIEAITVNGEGLTKYRDSDPLKYHPHAWNIIRTRQWATHVDLTWDLCKSKLGWHERCDYFFLPDEDILKDHHMLNYPRCLPMHLSYFDVKNSVIRNLKDLDVLIEKYIIRGRRRPGKGIYYLYFKVDNPGITTEKLCKYIVKRSRKYIKTYFTYTYDTTPVQNVYSFKLDVQ